VIVVDASALAKYLLREEGWLYGIVLSQGILLKSSSKVMTVSMP